MDPAPKMRRARKWLPVLLIGVLLAAVVGCHTVGYYTQAIDGQCQIITREESIDRVIANPKTPARVKSQLELVEQLRAFAKSKLELPVDGQYVKYADLHRPYVVWIVQGAGEFSLQPKTWWYPFVGRLEYRGYFSEKDAQACAERLQAEGDDVCVEGVTAYSTLGWFKDPVLNTWVFSGQPELAELIFHELGHQRLFARGDTDFNEAFATTVGQEGARRWLLAQGNTNLCERYLVSLQRNDQFVHLVLKTRRQLEKIYGDTRDTNGRIKAAAHLPAPPAQLLAEKRRALQDLRHDYAEMKSRWDGYSGYDSWFASDLNNAKLNSVANYYDYVPGFEQLLAINGGKLEKFYQAAKELSKLPKEQRHQQLRSLARERTAKSPSWVSKSSRVGGSP